jgi:type IV pilus assembly protein PilM
MASNKHTAVHLGTQTVALGSFSTGRRGVLVLEEFASGDLSPDPAEDANRLEESRGVLGALVKATRSKGQAVNYSVSSHSVFTRFVKLPPLDVDQLDQIVGFEAQQQVPFPIAEAVWDYQTLGSPDDPEVEVVLVALKADELEAVNQAVRSTGLETGKVDFAPLSVYNAFRYNYPDLDQTVLVIDIGARSTNLIYAEGTKFFVRTISMGARDVTQAIAREFDIPFADAEQRKTQDGFVALGGGYADHEDPEIAAMSKVIRNSLTRLHSEVIRTNNFYRSNQGGSAPEVVLLSGTGAGLPYLNEFFQEKLKIPVEYFNALRNVELGRRVDSTAVSAHAHALGELVGLGLRGVGPAPVEIELVPRVVARERQIARQGPLFWLAGLSLAALLGSAGFYYQSASAFAARKTAELKRDVGGLSRLAGEIGDEEARLERIRSRSGPYSDAVLGRVYWITTFRDLSEAMVDDKIWFVEMQPMSGENPLIGEARRASEAAMMGGAGDPMLDVVPAGEHLVDSLLVRGLWRENQEGGSKVVYNFLDRLRQSKRPFFDLVERDETGKPKVGEDGAVVKKFTDGELLNPINHGTAGDRHAWEFTLRLPLPEGRRIKYTK